MNHSWMNYTASGKPSPANLLQYEDDRSSQGELHMKKLMLAAALLFAGFPAQGVMRGEEVTYTANGTVMKGYIAYDDALKGRRPGILVVHEWWGSDEYARIRARMLAELGYTALALNMYGGGRQAHHPDKAGKQQGSSQHEFLHMQFPL